MKRLLLWRGLNKELKPKRPRTESHRTSRETLLEDIPFDTLILVLKFVIEESSPLQILGYLTVSKSFFKAAHDHTVLGSLFDTLNRSQIFTHHPNRSGLRSEFSYPPFFTKFDRLVYFQSVQLALFRDGNSEPSVLEACSVESVQDCERLDEWIRLKNQERIAFCTMNKTDEPRTTLEIHNFLPNFGFDFFTEIDFGHLTHLNLSKNVILFLPKDIGKCVNLGTLNLSYCQLCHIPPEIALCTSLRALHLSSNLLEELPEELNQLSNLHTLQASFNKLTKLPKLSGLFFLKFLSLGDNALQEFPEIFDCLSLEQLSLFKNQIKRIPKEIGRLSNLQSIDLNFNQITEIDDAMGDCRFLVSIFLQSNQITRLPPSFSELIFLQDLSISQNPIKIFPSLPSNIKNLCCASIGIQELPSDFTKFTRLQKLFIQLNPILQLPEGLFRHCHNLQWINCSFTQIIDFEESIVDKFQSFKNLKCLACRGYGISCKKVNQLVSKNANLRVFTTPTETPTWSTYQKGYVWLMEEGWPK